MAMNAKAVVIMRNERVSLRCRREELHLVPVPLTAEFARCYRAMTCGTKEQCNSPCDIVIEIKACHQRLHGTARGKIHVNSVRMLNVKSEGGTHLRDRHIVIACYLVEIMFDRLIIRD